MDFKEMRHDGICSCFRRALNDVPMNCVMN